MCVFVYIYIYECALKLIIDSFAFPVCPLCFFLILIKAREMVLCKETDTCLCMPKAIFSKLPARPRVLLSLSWPKVHLSAWAWQPTNSNTPFRSRTNSFCTAETLKDRAYNVRDLVLSCCGTCLQIRRGVKLIFTLHLIGGASRLIPKLFRKSYFCMNNREEKHQDM